MFRTLCLACSSIALVIVTAGSAYQEPCQSDTFECPTVSSSQCYLPDTSILPLCSPLPELPRCDAVSRSTQALCERQPWRNKPFNYVKCYKAASFGKIKQETRECYAETPCVWNATTGSCIADEQNRTWCYMTEWDVDLSEPSCQEAPPV
jgi:hypothetical protein